MNSLLNNIFLPSYTSKEKVSYPKCWYGYRAIQLLWDLPPPGSFRELFLAGNLGIFAFYIYIPLKWLQDVLGGPNGLQYYKSIVYIRVNIEKNLYWRECHTHWPLRKIISCIPVSGSIPVGLQFNFHVQKHEKCALKKSQTVCIMQKINYISCIPAFHLKVMFSTHQNEINTFLMDVPFTFIVMSFQIGVWYGWGIKEVIATKVRRKI